MSRHETVDKRHGRLERRVLESTGALHGYLRKWPRAKQAFRLRRWRDQSVETVYGIASLPWSRDSAARLLELSRCHWGIENSLHYVRDVTFQEDRCRTRNRNKAQSLAAFRNLAIQQIRRRFTCVPEGIEYYAEYRNDGIAMIQRTE